MSEHHFGIRNETPVVAWVFCIGWIAMILLVTVAVVVEGGLQQSDIIALAGTWCLSIVVILVILKTEVYLTVENDMVTVREFWLWKFRKEQFPATAIRAVGVVLKEDGDGGVTYCCIVQTPSGRTVTVSEGISFAKIEKVQSDLATAIARAKRYSEDDGKGEIEPAG